MLNKVQDNIFEKVVIIGPTRNGAGGISSVLKTYYNNIAGLRFRTTNSNNGTIAGLFVLAGTLLILPFDRMSGRKIAHIHYASGKSWIRKSFIMRFARLLGFKVVSHCHSAKIADYVSANKNGNFYKVLSKSKVNVVLSPQWKIFFDTKIGCGHTEIVNNIVSAPDKVDFGTVNSVTTFLFLGNIGDRKGIFDILQASVMLKQRGLLFRVLIGGNGDINRLKSEIKRLGLEEIVDYLGWVSGEGKNRLLADCDVLILPSYAEGLPISILEAMANGRAVISTPVGGITEVVHDGENGIIVEPGNIKQIAQAMDKYISDSTLGKRHGKAALRIVEPFYASSVKKRLEEIYKMAYGK